IGRAPPNGTRVRPRGSWPRSIETTRMPRVMLACDAQDAGRGGGQVEAERAGDARLDRACRSFGVEGQFAAELCVGAETAEHEVGIGHGRLSAAAPVAGGARHRLGAVRPDTERAALVDPSDRAAGRADRVDVNDPPAG